MLAVSSIADRTLAIDALTRPIQPSMEALQDFLDAEVAAFEPEVRDLAANCIRNSGKRIRPMLVFYGGWGAATEHREALVRAAAVVELVHLATLVHDDILDKARLRHNTSTLNEEYGSDIAVLVGDALFAHALHLAAQFPDVTVCRLVSASTRRVCAGEIAQNFERGNARLTFDTYYRIIELKTAELFHVSAQLGALIGGHGEAFSQAAGVYGRHLGTAYQIFDDLADLRAPEEQIGKTLGTDLANGKYTLPLLLLREAVGEKETQMLARHGDNGKAHLLHQAFVDHAVYTGVATAFDTQVSAALAALEPFAEIPAVEPLRDLANFVRALPRRYLPAES